jgi:hypothetical protein
MRGQNVRVCVGAACVAALIGLGAVALPGAQDERVQQVPAREQMEDPAPPATEHDVLQHLDRAEQIVDSLLAIAPPGGPVSVDDERTTDEPQRVGTAGTTVTPRTGETLLVERAKLEDLRVHVQQAREALRHVGSGPRRDP